MPRRALPGPILLPKRGAAVWESTPFPQLPRECFGEEAALWAGATRPESDSPAQSVTRGAFG